MSISISLTPIHIVNHLQQTLRSSSSKKLKKKKKKKKKRQTSVGMPYQNGNPDKSMKFNHPLFYDTLSKSITISIYLSIYLSNHAYVHTAMYACVLRSYKEHLTQYLPPIFFFSFTLVGLPPSFYPLYHFLRPTDRPTRF